MQKHSHWESSCQSPTCQRRALCDNVSLFFPPTVLPNLFFFVLLTHGFVRVSLIDCLNPADTSSSPSLKASQDALRIEAAHVIASLSYGLSHRIIFSLSPNPRYYLGSEEALSTLLRANTHHAIFYAISHFTKADPPILRAAFSRALRALAASIADIVGPSLWGLKRDNSIVRNDAQQALQYFFQVRFLHSLSSSLIHIFLRC